MTKIISGNKIRQQYIDYFVKKNGHTHVPSSSLVPGDDATLLFTNSGMVQFKDVFLGTDKRDYVRAVNSQKCMRVAGKHNDLEDVGFDDKHHTFFEMLGNWSFGDYYKKEAIEWAWELLTEIWGLPKEKLYVSVFKDELDEIPTDEDAAKFWNQQPGLNPEHIIFLGRKDNFWEMANTGPCGPNSEIHIDLGTDLGELTYREDGQVDLDGPRFVELWNLVFIQYNRTSPNNLDPLPSTHVDTGMGFDRIVAVLQNQSSNYRTDLFWPLIQKIQALSGQSDKEREENFTPYRVIADHARAATFLIADGVVPGNLGRNYVTRMVIRRASRFGTKINLRGSFLAKVAEVVIDIYSDAYPELKENRETILDNLTREEELWKGGSTNLIYY
jgi:alanyl-tRNA synthetase